MNQTLIEYFKDLQKFFNRRDVPTAKVISLMGRQRPQPVPGGATVLPHDKRFQNIIIRGDVRNMDILRMVTFVHPDHTLELTQLIETFGPYTAVWLEKENATLLRCTNFAEEDAIERIEHKIDGYKLEDGEGGFYLIQGEDSKVLVPFDQFLLPTTFIFFREFQRPPDTSGQKKPATPGFPGR